MNKKTGIIIQARMGATRLPNKVMLNLCGKPILWHVIERCKKANVDEIILATSINSENNVIEEFCKKNNYNFFRGSENDVLQRYYECAKMFGLDIIVRITADCPLISSKVINIAIKKFKQKEVDYLSNAPIRSFPRGLDVEVFSFNALKKVHESTEDKFQREHVTPFIYNNPKIFRVGTLIAEGLLKKPEIRLCIDTPQDLKLFRIIYNNLYHQKVIPIEEVIRFLDKNTDLIKMNQESEKEHLELSKELHQKFIGKT